MNDMNRGEKAYVSGALVAILGLAGYVWPMVRPPENQEQLRFENAVVRVDASQAIAWGADVSAITDWGVPVEFVDHDADVTFSVGETRSQKVPGFGTLYVAAEARRHADQDNWASCTIKLSSRSQPDHKSANAVVAHEFAHCYGVDHDDKHLSVMSTIKDSKTVPNKLFSYTPTEHDRAVLRKIIERSAS